MYYIVKNGTPKSEEIKALFKKLKACNKQARLLSEEIGATGYYRSTLSKGGGIYCLTFEPGKVPPGWKKKASGYYPRRNVAANKEIIKKIEALPMVDICEWAHVFTSEICEQPGCFAWEGDYYVEGKNLLEDKGFIRIKMSEYALAHEGFEAERANIKEDKVV